MSRSSVKPKLNRYEKIVARADGMRPMTVAELITGHLGPAQKCFVLNFKMLTQAGNTMEIKWSEREADAEAKRRAKR